jgi:hypothetical protein
MKIDMNTLKTQLKNQSLYLKELVKKYHQNQNNFFNKLGYSLLAFVVIYNFYLHIY